MYKVPENNRSIPLCIDVGAIISVNKFYNITAQQTSPPQAEGKLKYELVVATHADHTHTPTGPTH